MLTIRAARESDAAAVVGLWRALDDVVRSVTDDVATVGRLLERDPEALLLAEVDGRVVGSLIVGWDGWRGNLYRLVVAHDHRRRGTAAALVAEAERHLRSNGCRRVAAAVVLTEAPAVGFWTDVGYTIGDQVGRYVKTLDAASNPAR